MVPGMISGILGYNFINFVLALPNETAITAIREIDGGKGLYFASIIGGQKG
jgi:electron transfer flavoprotein beta subunit